MCADLWNLIYQNCLRSSEKAYNITEMLSAAVSYNSRLAINGQEIKNRMKKLNVEDLVKVVVAAYCLSYVTRYGAGKTIETFTQQEKAKRSNSGIGMMTILEFVGCLLTPEGLKRRWNTFVEFLSEKKNQRDLTFDVSSSVRVLEI